METLGGGERQLIAYYNHLKKYNIDVKLFDMWAPGLENCNIFHCFSAMPGLSEICSYIKSKNIKLVVSPNIWVTHETRDQYPFEYIWNLFEMADRVVVNSDIEGNTLSDVFSMKREKFSTVHNGIDSDFLVHEEENEFRQRFNITGAYTLNIANVELRKNQLRMLESLKEVAPQLKLVTVGYIRDQLYYNDCVALGSDQFIWIEPQPQSSSILRSALQGCDFFSMPSLCETPSIATLEAAGYGKRILSTYEGSVLEYFREDHVAYVNPLDITSIKSGIKAVYNIDPSHTTWAARNKFLWIKIIPNLISLYRDIQEEK